MKAQKSAYASTFHRNGDVTFWNVYQQVWQREPASRLNQWDDVLASMSPAERQRIARIASR